ncbi:MAG: bifunctional phosphopantothenoylcysteine decarboxylase/phosphopantothenate--cysteine ligase CoaBC [Firmicutes bacterium]|jgi:phosphopantothenoylcysteine decarboxylase/phosphopantothenate--cysteine ligase|nr:bifunctional phosphopantothenoylcysteine decarboxylase/phosphopantothenate--cysteine ligase CoaBC [Bacillota bacterium]
MEGKTVVLGVTGGIAAYKSVEIASLLVKRGVSVHVVMTEAATRFVAPLTFRTISGNPVSYEMFREPDVWDVLHVSLAEIADILVVAPATANCLGKVAHGIADDLLTTVIMATKAPVLLVPSMNEGMYLNPIVTGNVEHLRTLGYHVMDPGFGYLACGKEGKGRLPEPQDIVPEIERILLEGTSLRDVTVLVTAGPTQEPLDPVRYITNRSSGKMGYELAKAAKERGARAILVTGPSALPSPFGVNVIQVRTAHEMFQAVMDHLSDTDVIIGAAAPCDFRPRDVASEKMKKREGLEHILLARCDDIMLEVGKLKGERITVGFAAETRDLIKNAKDKLVSKNLDFIVANDVSRHDSGFESDYNEVKILYPGGHKEDLPYMTKRQVAGEILDRVESLLHRPYPGSDA